MGKIYMTGVRDTYTLFGACVRCRDRVPPDRAKCAAIARDGRENPYL